MGSIVANLGESIGKQLSSYVDLPKVVAPFTTIVNRATVTDLSQDLLPRMGLDTFQFNGLMELPGEFGPNGERVMKPINDIHDQARYYGGQSTLGDIDGHGISISGMTVIEITFYGTGLIALIESDAGSRSIKSQVDGGTLSGELYVQSSGAIGGRNYSTNQRVVVASGLTLGMHTVSIQSPQNVRYYGWQVLTQSGTSPNVLQLVPGSAYQGSQKLTKTALSVDSYNSNFETGTLGTKGGHVVVYIKADGTIGKAVQPTDTSLLTGSSTSHTNENIIRAYSPREFGASRNAQSGTPDDFSLDGNTTRSRAFTLNDGTTGLTGANARFLFNGVNGTDDSLANTTGDTAFFTFVGTGIDFLMDHDTVSTNVTTISIDGGSTFTISPIATGAGNYILYKVASGLPYGTHVVKYVNTSGSNFPVHRFVTYGPKKPSIPTGGVEIADYYIMANYSFVGATTDQAALQTTKPSNGTLLKAPSREQLYVGTWTTTSIDTTFNYGFDVFTNTTNDYVEFSFYGTGFEAIVTWSSSTPTFTIKDNGTLYTGAASVATSNTWTPGTGTWVIGGTSGRIGVSALTLGHHVVRFTFTGGGTNPQFCQFAAITPVHNFKQIGPYTAQNVIDVGSQSIGDSRNFSPVTVKAQKAWGQAVGIGTNSSPTTSSAGTATVPIADMTCVIKTTGNPIEISGLVEFLQSVAGDFITYHLFVDGSMVYSQGLNPAGSNQGNLAPIQWTYPVAAGVHIVQLFFAAQSGSTVTAFSTNRTLRVREIS